MSEELFTKTEAAIDREGGRLFLSPGFLSIVFKENKL